MVNIQQERAFISDIEKKVRNLELEKAKLEQQKEFAAKTLEENKAKIAELGYTPENIGEGINKISTTIEALKAKINSVFENVNNTTGGDSCAF